MNDVRMESNILNTRYQMSATVIRGLLFNSPENSYLLGPLSSTAASPEKTTLSVDFGCTLLSIADLKSNQINFRLTVRRFVSVESSWAAKVAS